PDRLGNRLGDARPRRPARAARDVEAAQGMKPYSEASERNRAPILAVLKRIFIDRKIVLEIGSGTGQHAAYFAPELPHLRWQASDVAANLPPTRQWFADAIALDVEGDWPKPAAGAAFSANTAHSMSWPEVQKIFTGIARPRP